MANTQTKIVPEFTDADKRETTFFKFEVEKQEVIGKLKSVEVGSFGEQYVIDTPDGDITIGTYGVLKSKIVNQDVGKWIKILYKGEVVNPKTKRTYKDFDVFIK
jgi:hypothetical protein